MRLSGKTALITGAASGIGEAIARTFAAEGAQVLVSDVNAEQGAAVAQTIGDMAIFHRLDVTKADDWQAIAAEINAMGGLDILVNNAGAGTGGGIGRETLEAHKRVYDINVTGIWHGVRATLACFDQKGGGSIINISSIDGLMGVEGLSTYVGSKFAVTGMTKSLALELGARNIRVNALHPGIIATPMVLKNTVKSMERLEKAVARQPIPRMGQPQEIAKAALFFASDDSSFCTGASLVVDGGHIAGPYRDSLI